MIHGQVGIDPPLLRALIGKDRGHTEEIPGLHLRDVAGEGDPQQIVGPPSDGLALGHGLLALVVVPQPLSVGTDPVQKVRHRPGQSFLRQRPGANVVLFQIRKPPHNRKTRPECSAAHPFHRDQAAALAPSCMTFFGDGLCAAR